MVAAPNGTDGMTTDEDNPPISATAHLPAYLAIEFLADAAAEEAAKLGVSGGEKKGIEAAAVSGFSGRNYGLFTNSDCSAIQLFHSLIEHDPIRTKYWEHRAKESVANVV